MFLSYYASTLNHGTERQTDKHSRIYFEEKFSDEILIQDAQPGRALYNSFTWSVSLNSASDSSLSVTQVSHSTYMN